MDFETWWASVSGKGCLLRGESEDYYLMAWEAAVAAEREACATVAERWGQTHDEAVTVNARNAGSKIGRGIRTRSNA